MSGYRIPDWQARFGLSRVPEAERKALLERFKPLLVDVGYPIEDVEKGLLHNQELVYAPITYIGSVGALFIKSTAELVALGSHVDIGLFLWAHDRGIAIASMGRNRLVVSKMRVKEGLVRGLRQLASARYLRDEVVRCLQNGDAVEFNDVCLYFAIADLFQAEQERWFDFEVAPV